MKVTVNLKPITKNLRKRLKQYKKNLSKPSTIIINEIVKDSRGGLGYDGQPFPFLKGTTVDRRWDMQEDGVETHSKFSPAFSNATISGQLIQSIAAKKVTGKIVLKPKGNHKPYGKGYGKKQVANISIMKGLQDRGWKIMGVSDNAKKRIVNDFRRFLRRVKK